ncbi:NAD(P)H-hydrate dehydratase [Thermopirellula anaerolimosa]
MDAAEPNDAVRWEPLPKIPPRPPESHKGDFGTVLVIGGSAGMAGAPALAGMAALRGGAGLVRIAVPEPCLTITAAFEPSYMVFPLPADRKGRMRAAAYDVIRRRAAGCDWLVLGPGLGRSLGLDLLVDRLYRECPLPMVVDADALNALARGDGTLPEPGGPRVLTPHPGEFRRLVPSAACVRSWDEKWDAAAGCASRWRAVVVLKGHRTFVTDGERRYLNDTGNPGMATGGSGDVLSGLIAALGAQGFDPFSAAQLGVHTHGKAGDLAASELGQQGMIASDLVRFLPRALLAAAAGT